MAKARLKYVESRRKQDTAMLNTINPGYNTHESMLKPRITHLAGPDNT